MTAENTLRIARQYSDEALRTVNENARLEAIRAASERAWTALLRAVQAVKRAANELPTAPEVVDHLRSLLRDEICRNNVFYVCIGIGVGTVGGFMLGAYWSRPLAPPVMKAIACTHLDGPNCVTLCHTAVPVFGSRPCDIMIRVRAATVNRLDARITRGYGRFFRQLVQCYGSSGGGSFHERAELPLPLGRACAGVVEAVGAGSRSGLEIGDEVWVASAWWEAGVATELVVAPECRVGRKPFIIGFEGAASLPYSGCVALAALHEAGLDERTCRGRRVLVQDGCSPVGCVLTQLCRKWGAATVAATCSSRSVPVITALGADDVIALSEIATPSPTSNGFDGILPPDADELLNMAADRSKHEQHVLFKELSIRPEYDVIFYTGQADYDTAFMHTFLSANGRLVDTVEPAPSSDATGAFGRLVLSLYVKMRRLYAAIAKSPPDWGGPHLCHRSLDRLAEYVNDGVLQTVVDQVYTPSDSSAAMDHVCGSRAIGSTIITFRS